MARVASDSIATSELYKWLAGREQKRVAHYARHEVASFPYRYPRHRLEAFRRGEAVELEVWRLPLWARPFDCDSWRVMVFPDGAFA